MTSMLLVGEAGEVLCKIHVNTHTDTHTHIGRINGKACFAPCGDRALHVEKNIGKKQ
jgi:hypothetical protein